MPVYSHSRISSFENCPLQYRYRYIDRVKRDVEGIEAFVGKLVHEVLESLYSDREAARRSDAQPWLRMFDDLWTKKLTPSVRIVRENMTVADYRALGLKCIETFFGRYHPFDTGEVVGCETRVEFSLDGEGRYRILGFIDRVDRVAPGVYEIHDYKTGSLPRTGALKSDRQLSLYEMAIRERFEGVQEVRQVWHYLAHDKEFTEKRSTEQLQKTRLGAIRSIQSIEATAQFPARVSPLCSWCEYQEICPEWEGKLQRAEAAAPEMDPKTGQFQLFPKVIGR